MKKLDIIARLAVAAALALAASSCVKDDEDGKKPEEEDVKLECQGVYFDTADLQEYYLVDADKAGSVTFKVARAKADGAITVPVSAKASAGEINLTIPAEVSFAADSKTAEIVVNYPAGIPTKTPVNIDLELTGEHVDAFTAAGSATASTQVIAPEKVRARSRIYDVGGSYLEKYGQWAQEIWIVTEDWIVLKGFTKSDVDITLKATGHDDKYGLTHYAVKSATAGYSYYYEDYGDYTWYLTDANGDWMSFYPYGESAWFTFAGCSLLYMDTTDPIEEYDIFRYDGGTTLYVTMTECYYTPNVDKAVYYDQLVYTWGESAANFEETLPEYVEEAKGTIPCQIYFASNPSSYIETMGDWDGYDFFVEDFLGHGRTTFSLSNPDMVFSGLSCSQLAYDSDYACYYGLIYVNLGGYVQLYIDYPSEYTYYDYDSNTFNFSCQFYVQATDNFTDYDTLVVKILED